MKLVGEAGETGNLPVGILLGGRYADVSDLFHLAQRDTRFVATPHNRSYLLSIE